MIKNVVPQDIINEIYDRLVSCVPDAVGNVPPKDSQVTNKTTSSYFRRLQDIHFKLTPAVSKIFGKELLPTVDHSRFYTKGATLKLHRDKDYCEYAVTINIRNVPSDESWCFAVANENNGVWNRFFMSPGDAVFYNGPVEYHGRNELPYDMCYQTFLYFVDANGEHAGLGWKNYKELI